MLVNKSAFPFLASLAIVAFVLPGCGDNPLEPRPTLNPSFGNSVQHNMAVQIVDPEASAGITEAPVMNGDRAVRALTRYRLGETERVVREKTSEK